MSNQVTVEVDLDAQEQKIEESIFKNSLDENECYHSHIIYENAVNKIKNGNINPSGNTIDTPATMSIALKLHQKRLVYEMLEKEKIQHRVSSGLNAFCLADKVGAGKSIDVLALVSHSPNVDNLQPNKLLYKTSRYTEFKGCLLKPSVEFKTNLIIIPHGIYNQWINYIQQFTVLSYYGISYTRDIEKIPYSKMISGECKILLVKSTRYTDVMVDIYTKYPYNIQTINSVFESQSDTLKNVYENMYSVYGSLRTHDYNSDFISNFEKLKSAMVDVNISQLKKDIDKVGKFKLEYLREYTGPIFQRVFIDEVNSIKIARCAAVYGKVNWFITSSVEDLLYPHGKKDYYANKILINGIKGSGFIKDTFYNNSGKNLTNFIQDMYLKNSDKFVEDSFELPEPIEIKISCYTPPEIKALQGVALPEVIQALNAGDINSAINKVGCNISNEDSIVEAVLSTLNGEFDIKSNILKNKTIQLETLIKEIETSKNNLEQLKILLTSNDMNSFDITDEDTLGLLQLDADIYSTDLDDKRTTRNNLKKSIKLYTEQVSNLKFKIDSLKSRITNVKDKDCPICAQKVSNPCMTPCCKNIFCFGCMAQAIHYSPKCECPLCRKPNITLQKLTAITTDNIVEENKEEDKLPTKIQSLLKLIEDNPMGRFLVFSEYENSFNEIVSEFNKNGITYSKLCGSSGHISNIIKKYTSNELKVLLLNAKHYGSGLNLQMTSDIIIFHRMSNDLEKQVIGRGQRLGRNCTLNVNYLCYENEL